METKKYSSYAAIESDLAILKLEREINYKKMVFSFEKTKENLEPQKIVSGLLASYKGLVSSNYLKIINIAIPYFVHWIINKKRG